VTKKLSTSLRAKRRKPEAAKEDWIASSQELLAMTLMDCTLLTLLLREGGDQAGGLFGVAVERLNDFFS
jgi:hypothetical protein